MRGGAIRRGFVREVGPICLASSLPLLLCCPSLCFCLCFCTAMHASHRLRSVRRVSPSIFHLQTRCSTPARYLTAHSISILSSPARTFCIANTLIDRLGTIELTEHLLDNIDPDRSGKDRRLSDRAGRLSVGAEDGDGGTGSHCDEFWWWSVGWDGEGMK